ncbi:MULTISPECIES: WecB/TagA/CpsF family glycosyltransferase [Methylobacterium]|uniref:WecB/TagA/CpsF family glycosyltransferase n=1 Tax=Methylobacterium TaxID=407 RepID=UPI0009EA57F6|nr:MULTISPECIES: WecB/TagA/CpsF family glycosyltransferase [Methylobacterium]MCI9882120.1 WecB/TagA/CpsF family glycosyltransferase [Methylobacterium goesingense]
MSLRLFDITFTPGTAADILATSARQPATRPRLIVTANLDHVVTLSENAAFRKAYDGAVAHTLDGMPLVWMARLCGGTTVQRVTGHDLIAAAFADPWPAGRQIFLVCSSEAVGLHLTERLVSEGAPRASIAFTVPPFGFENDDAYSADLCAAVRTHGTTLLVLGVGAPRSEIWVDRQGTRLGGPVVLAVGEALNVAAGLVPRAPALMQRIGLEWFFRFWHAPHRLFRRYFVRSWGLFGIVLRRSLARKTRPRPHPTPPRPASNARRAPDTP